VFQLIFLCILAVQWSSKTLKMVHLPPVLTVFCHIPGRQDALPDKRKTADVKQGRF
jgi:hypothetical protein